jgi:hypothetical protein
MVQKRNNIERMNCMEKRFLISIFLVAIFIISGCTASEQEDKGNLSKDGTSEGATVISEQTNENTTSSNDVFSIIINNTVLSLLDLEHETNLELLLGKPISQDIENLTGDGFTGSFKKKLTYDGLEMELFAAPPLNNVEQEFGIMTIKLTNENYQTSKGIGIGSKVEEVQRAYQGIKIALDGRTDPNNCMYEIKNELEYNYLRFEVNEGAVSEVRVYHLIP